MRNLLLLIVFLTFSIPAFAQTYTVERVIDSNTIVVTTPEGKSETVDLIGIDIPESEPNDKAKRDAEALTRQSQAEMGKPHYSKITDASYKFDANGNFSYIIRTADDLETIPKMGQEATEFIRKLDLGGKNVCLTFDVQQRDEYGRLLAYVTIGGYWDSNRKLFEYDNTFVCEQAKAARTVFLNRLLIKEGYASPMTIPPNVKYAELFKELYKEARENNRGLWK